MKLTRRFQWARARFTAVVLVVVGFAVGALVFRGGRGPASDAHADHAMSGDAMSGDTMSGDTTVKEGKPSVWTCAMHPQIRSAKPGKCPICGMDLVPVDASGSGEDASRTVVLSERAKALSKLRTVTVRRQVDASGGVRLLGRVEPNETTLRTVTAWTGGRIDRLYVNVTGERVKAGQTIATLYSPEVFAAHQDLLVAKRQLKRMASSVESARLAASAALDATRERLRLLGVPDAELTRMETQESPTRSVAIRTPFGGTVIERVATEGAYVTTGAPLYRIADLRHLWIQLDAYESDLPRLALGQTVRVEVEAFPGEEFSGKVTFIDPVLDARRRTARVRVAVDNADGRLRPGMFAQAVVSQEAQKAEDAPLVIPSTAPLFTGRRSVVYVEVTRGEEFLYEARVVRLGPRLGNVYPVVAGLSEGERVVSRGAFVLDADLQIRGGTSMMMTPDDREPGEGDDAIQVPREELRRLAPVVAQYLAMQRALASDDLALAQAAALKLEEALPKATLERPSEAVKLWTEIARTMSSHARHVAQANALEPARMGFEALSTSIAMMLRRLGNPLDQPLVQAHCPMAFGSRGASWIQEGKEIDNAYFGKSMKDCGDVEQSVDPGAHLRSVTEASTPKPAAKSATKPGRKPAPKSAAASAKGHHH